MFLLNTGFRLQTLVRYCSLTQEKVMKPLGILSLKVELEKIKGHHYQQIVNGFILTCSKDVKTYHVQNHSQSCCVAQSMKTSPDKLRTASLQGSHDEVKNRMSTLDLHTNPTLTGMRPNVRYLPLTWSIMAPVPELLKENRQFLT